MRLWPHVLAQYQLLCGATNQFSSGHDFFSSNPYAYKSQFRVDSLARLDELEGMSSLTNTIFHFPPTTRRQNYPIKLPMLFCRCHATCGMSNCDQCAQRQPNQTRFRFNLLKGVTYSPTHTAHISRL